MGTLIGAIIARTGWSEQIARAVAYATFIIVIAVALALGKCTYDRSVIAHHDAKVEQRSKPATDQAATERSNDAIAESKSEQEMHNVIAAAPDQPIAPTSRAHACEQLRRAGRNPAACR